MLQRFQKTLSVRHLVKKSRLTFGKLHALSLRASHFSVCVLSCPDDTRDGYKRAGR